MSESPRACSPDEPTAVKPCEAEPASTPAPLQAEDFYYENGLVVFTAAYHTKRGYCCNSGCRHCPFH